MIDLAIIGAGPAGMEAARAASRFGLSVAVFDEQQRPGGQIFRQRPVEFTGESPKYPAGYPWASQLIADSEAASGVEWNFQTTVLGVLRDRAGTIAKTRLAVTGPSGTRTIAAKRVLLATGAYDMPVAIPGWTLPGVMMAGAVQGFIKGQGLLTAERLVLAGSHPLLLVVADQLRKSGADIAEVAFARSLPNPREMFASMPAVPGHIGLFAESAVAVSRLMKAGVKVSTSTIVSAAHGDRHLNAVELRRVDKSWKPTGAPRRIETDALVLGYGFQPSVELAKQAGCELVWDSPKGGWIVTHDDSMRTSIKDLYVAGEPTGVAGAEQSRAEGKLAALSIAKELAQGTGLALRSSPIDQEMMRARKQLVRAERFSRVVQRLFEPAREALSQLAKPDTVICRCELVTKDDICGVLAKNPTISTASAVKLECRSGMGPCQGRYCESAVSSLVSCARQRPYEQVGYFASHFPVKPVPVSSLAMFDDESSPELKAF